jgi:hypothetical protein
VQSRQGVPAEPGASPAFLAPLHKTEWAVHAKKPFAGPQAVLAYLSRQSPADLSRRG